MKCTARKESWPLAKPFTIARETVTEANVIVVEIESDGLVGRCEAVPVARYDQTCESSLQAFAAIQGQLEQGISRGALQQILPPTALRNAIDCALWDLEARQQGRRVWEMTGYSSEPRLICMTLGINPIDVMAMQAREYEAFEILKIKLNALQPMETMAAIRNAVPTKRLVIDANEAWTLEELKIYAPQLQELGVELIEQPLKRGEDAELLNYNCPVPLAADESCFDRSDLEFLRGRYDYINIKLDKTGGLTEALALVEAGKEQGFGIMVGCMSCTSLAMAPAFVVGQSASFCDLDGHLFLRNDRQPVLPCKDGYAYAPEVQLWG